MFYVLSKILGLFVNPGFFWIVALLLASLLITSATHMRRSYSCFEKVGLNCDTFCTDFQSGARQWNIEALFVPQTNVLFKWNAFIHELVGLLIYKVMRYI